MPSDVWNRISHSSAMRPGHIPWKVINGVIIRLFTLCIINSHIKKIKDWLLIIFFITGAALGYFIFGNAVTQLMVNSPQIAAEDNAFRQSTISSASIENNKLVTWLYLIIPMIPWAKSLKKEKKKIQKIIYINETCWLFGKKKSKT